MRRTQLLAGLGTLILLISSIAFAEVATMRARIPDIISLKNAGAIGERSDGLLGVVKSSPKAEAVVKAENKDRRILYQQRAKKGGYQLDTFMKVMGTERIKKEKSGRYIQNSQKKWVKK